MDDKAWHDDDGKQGNMAVASHVSGMARVPQNTMQW